MCVAGRRSRRASWPPLRGCAAPCRTRPGRPRSRSWRAGVEPLRALRRSHRACARAPRATSRSTRPQSESLQPRRARVRLGTCLPRGPVAGHLQRLPEPARHAPAIVAVEQRHRSLEVVDRRLVRVVGLRGLARLDEVFALLRHVLAQPEVVREEVDVPVDRVRLRSLDERARALVQVRADRERHARVRHLLGDDVPEDPCLFLFPVQAHEVERAEHARGGRVRPGATPARGRCRAARERRTSGRRRSRP